MTALLSQTFKFELSQLSEACHSLYHGSLTMVTNLRPVLSEQLDLRATADFALRQAAKQKVIEYIRVRVAGGVLRDEGDLEVAFC